MVEEGEKRELNKGRRRDRVDKSKVERDGIKHAQEVLYFSFTTLPLLLLLSSIMVYADVSTEKSVWKGRDGMGAGVDKGLKKSRFLPFGGHLHDAGCTVTTGDTVDLPDHRNGAGTGSTNGPLYGDRPLRHVSAMFRLLDLLLRLAVLAHCQLRHLFL